MRIFSGKPRVDAATARNCFLVNQFATPGLGSLMAGRLFEGLGQLLLAIAGFILVLIWFALVLRQAYAISDFAQEPQVRSPAPFGEGGALVFGIAWLWALSTSVRLLRKAGKLASSDKVSPPGLPPQPPADQ